MNPLIPTQSIRDYFTPNITSATRADAQPSTPEHAEEHAEVGSRELRAKKIRITADNGRDIALRGVQDRKIKRERTEDSVGTSKSASGLARRAAGRAKLGLLPSVPLDVLFEIFSHLAPLDILRLARTTKELRRLLLHRSSTFVWKATLSNVEGLPACPEDLSLPCWTNLIFDRHCQNCLTNNVKKCDFALRVRYCKKCAKDKLLQQSSFDRNVKLHQIILKCIPFSNWNSGFVPYCTVADRNKLLDDLEIASSSENPSARSEFVAKRRAEVKARLAHARECKKWVEGVFRIRECELEDARKARADAIRGELIKLGYRAELEFLDELQARVCAINPWPTITLFEQHPLVKPPKPLTEKAWAAMKDEMLEYMTEASRLRTQNIRCIAIRNRRVLVHTAYVTWRTTPENLSRYPADSPMPNPADVLEFPPIERLIHTDTNIELDMDRDIMPCLIRALPSEIAEWREKVASALWIKMLESRVWAEAGWWHEPVRERRWEWRLRFLERAVVVFRCKDRSMHCRWEQARLRADVVFPAGTPNVTLAIAIAAENQDHAPVMWHPQFVHHQCTSMTFQGYVERITRTYESLSVEREYKQCRHAPWDAKTLVFDEQASRATRNILEACGMDWRETTTKQLDQRNPRLACLKCSFGARCDGERQVRVWTWRDAVQHCLKAHFGDVSVTWECLSPKDTTQAHLFEIMQCVSRGFHSSTKQKIWRCIKCRDTTMDTGRMNWDALAEHFRRNPTHGDVNNMDDEEGTMYYRALDVFPREGPPVKMTPSKTDPAQAGNSNSDCRSMVPSFLEWLLRSP
ncbi:hypothetical protein BJ912DRAFT_1043290 [Pholiota molesta]|nr:hypothetical protein BJ912DRAFT_1043290 [Pholiota molesta]